MQLIAGEWVLWSIWPTKRPYPSRRSLWGTTLLVVQLWVRLFPPHWASKQSILELESFPCILFVKPGVSKTYCTGSSFWNHFSAKDYHTFWASTRNLWNSVKCELLPFNIRYHFKRRLSLLRFYLPNVACFVQLTCLNLLWLFHCILLYCLFSIL